MLYIKTKKLTKKVQVLCGLQVVFFLFNCQTPEHLGGRKLKGNMVATNFLLCYDVQEDYSIIEGIMYSNN